MAVAQGGVMGLLAGRYAIERELGQGATAIVHLARDTHAGISVAVKVLRPELAESNAAKRFLKEIRRTASLDHPRILKVLDSGEHEGRPFFVLPYMEGGTLRQRLRRDAQLPLDEAITIARSVAEALDYAHERGLIHQDVKPENILFTGGVACLGDFGIAHALEAVYGEASSTAHVIRGTPAYMSPEQAAGEINLDGRSDQYSLACVFYEMVTGMPAFMGPTPESVIAQRFTHGPRELRVYRPTVPDGFEDALSRALTMIPADRYETSIRFIGALESATRTLSVARQPHVGARARLTRRSAAAILAAGLVAAGWAATQGGADPNLDTTRVVILPFEGDNASAAADLLHEGLRRWHGITVVETFATLDAIRRHGGIRTLEDARRVTASLGAGRFIRGRYLEADGRRGAYGALYDVETEQELHNARVWLPADSFAVGAFSELAHSLLLRGAAGEPNLIPDARPASLPAMQAFVAARLALGEWDLATTDSLLVRSLELDAGYVRAHYWLAQVRSWMAKPVSEWRASSQRAAAEPTAFTEAERPRVAALMLLGTGNYPAACDAYRRLTQSRERDFTAWFGLGECHRLDRVVVPDSSSPSGWRYRTSYYQGMQAYRQAFEVFPTSYREFQPNAYERLQQLLFTSGSFLRRGFSGDSARQLFLANPTASGDTIAFIPFPQDVVLAGHISDPAAVAAAAARGRQILHDVTAKWAAELPTSAGTKEAVAVSLEMLGDVAAARDSFLVARRLSGDPEQRVRLAVQEAIAGVKLGLRRGPGTMQSARLLTDSILAAAQPRSAGEAELLARLAVVTGHCEVSAALTRRAARPLRTGFEVPPGILARVFEQTPRIALGCDPATDIPSLVEGLPRGLSPDARIGIEYALVGALAAMGFPENPQLIARLARATSDYVLTAQNALLSGDTATARTLLDRAREGRRALGNSDFLPDVAITEARLWLALRDTTTAVELLDQSLASVAVAQPLAGDYTIQHTLLFASIGRAFALRADLARARREPASRWAELLVALWKDADPELQPVVRRNAGAAP